MVNEKILPLLDNQKLLSVGDLIWHASTFNTLKTNLEEITQLFRTRKTVLVSDVQKVLPDIINKTITKQKNSSEIPFNVELIQQLEQQKEKLFKNALQIPNKKDNMEDLFEHIKEEISNLELGEVDLDILKNPEVVTALLEQLSDRLSETLEEQATLTIVHPMTLELAWFLAELFQELPDTLTQLIPFLNPKSISAIFNSELAQALIKVVLGENLSLEHLSQDEAELSFAYKVTINSIKSSNNTFVIDASQYYSGKCGLWRNNKKPSEHELQQLSHSYYILTETDFFYFDKSNHNLRTIHLNESVINPYHPNSLDSYFHKHKKIEVLSPEQLDLITRKTSEPRISRHKHINYRLGVEALILSAINGGIAYCQEIPALKGAYAKSNLLQNFLVFESETIKEDLRLLNKSIASHEQDCNRLNQSINEINLAIENNTKLIKTLEETQIELTTKLDVYTSKPFEELLTDHPLKDQVIIDEKAGYDLSYVKQILPTTIVGKSCSDSKIKIIPIKNALDTFIKTQRHSLKLRHYSMLTIAQQLIKTRESAINSWVEEMHASYLKQLNTFEQDLDLIMHSLPIKNTIGASQDISKKSKSRQQPKAVENSSIDDQIKTLELQLKEIEAKSAALEQLKMTFSEWSQTPFANALNLEDESLKHKLASLSQTLALDTTAFSEKMNKAILQTKQKASAARQELEHVRLDKEHGIEDAKLLKELVTTKMLKEETMANQKTLSQEIALLETQIGKTTTIQSLEKKLNQCIEDLKTSVSEAITVIQKPRELFNEPKLIENESISPERFIEFVNTEENLLSRLINERLMPILSADEHAFIKKAYSLINHCEKIPHLEIDSLQENQEGFKQLIHLLDLENAINLKELDLRWFSTASWADFKNCQDNYNIPIIKTTLQKTIAEKLAIMNDFITKKDVITLTTDLLQQIKNDFQKTNAQKIQCETQIATEINQQSQALQSLKSSEENLTLNLQAIDSMITVFETLKAHKDLISALKDEDSVARLEASRNDLLNKLQAFSQQLRQSNLDKSYEIQKNKINEFLVQADSKLTSTLMDNYSVTCVNFHNEHSLTHQILREGHKALIANQEIDSSKRAQAISELLNKIKVLSGFMEEYEAYIKNEFDSITKKARKTLFDLNQAPNKCEQDQAYKDLNQKIDELQSNLNMYLDNQRLFQKRMEAISEQQKTLLALDEKTSPFSTIKDKSPESKSQFASIQRQLQEVQETLQQFANNGDMEEINGRIFDEANRNTLKKELTSLEEIRESLIKKHEDSVKIIEALSTRITARETLVETLSIQLDTYLTQRNERFEWKDKLDASDKGLREGYVGDLKTQLEAYETSGESAPLRKAIHNTQKKLTKGLLSRQLDRMLLSIIDSDYNIPSDYTSTTDNLEPNPEERVKKHPDKDYAEGIDRLYKQIEGLVAFSQTQSCKEDQAVITELAQALKQHLDYFVVKTLDTTPTVEAYTLFTEEFRIRLHSKDEELSQHRDLWRPFLAILANITLGLITLGFAVGVKLIHSKVTTGQFSFFCEKTERLEKIEVVDELVKQIQAPAVA